jgi:hypothetical protein
MGDSSRPYEISYELRPRYLYAFAKGDLSDPQTRIDCWKEIITRCREANRDHLLVVQDSPSCKSTSDTFVAASGVVGLGVKGLKIAFVDPDPAEFENNRFCETVARNRGANAKLFLTEGPAHEWLLGAEIPTFDPSDPAATGQTRTSARA